jgi:hypothetical protein
MAFTLSSLSATLAAIVKDAKFLITTGGAALAAANEILPFVPAQWQHWVSAGIAFVTIIVRDANDVVADLEKFNL